jgi:hypothetical protein
MEVEQNDKTKDELKSYFRRIILRAITQKSILIINWKTDK